MTFVDAVLRLLLAAALGAVLGLEREFRQKPAGLRTNMLIALGAALFTVVSVTISGADGSADRVAAQIVTGIGFVGGGAILRWRGNVHGVTTAATIWVNAAIGMAAGSGLLAVATAAAAITLAVLVVLPPIEGFFARRARLTEKLSEHRQDE